MTNKEKYNVFCDSKKAYIPIFSQPWWLDSVCGADNWDVYVVDKNGEYKAAMPYYIELRDGCKVITKAKNTQNNGILIAYPKNQKYTTRLDYEDRIINEIIEFIESMGLTIYEQQYHYSFQNWLPFFWNNYSAMIRYTYVIEDTSDLKIVEENYSPNVRNGLRKAEKTVHLCNEEISVEDFFEVNKMSFERQGKEIPYNLDFVRNIYLEGKKREAVKILAAEDAEENIHSVAFLVWDTESVYYLLNGTNPKFKNSQANCFLIHESIKFAHELNLKFDFEGSVIKPIENAFRQYGGIRKPYFRIYKAFNEK